MRYLTWCLDEKRENFLNLIKSFPLNPYLVDFQSFRRRLSSLVTLKKLSAASPAVTSHVTGISYILYQQQTNACVFSSADLIQYGSSMSLEVAKQCVQVCIGLRGPGHLPDFPAPI
jgi:hypothetical protein